VTKKTEAKSMFDREQLVDAGHKAWLAGLGAYVTVSKEAGDLFDRLVEKGKKATPDMPDLSGMMDDATGRAKKLANKVGEVVHDGTVATLHRFGVPTSEDIQGLTRRVDRLTEKVDALTQVPAGRTHHASHSHA